jgi:hypothetical protein
MCSIAMTLPPVAGVIGQVSTVTFNSTYPSNALGQTNYYTIAAADFPAGATLSGTGVSFSEGIYTISSVNPTVTISSSTTCAAIILVTAVGAENSRTVSLSQNWAAVFCPTYLPIVAYGAEIAAMESCYSEDSQL